MSDELGARVSAGMERDGRREGAVFRADLHVEEDPEYHDFPIDCTATSHGELLTGLSALMFRNYRNLMPELELGVLKLETRATNREGTVTPRVAILPLSGAVSYLSDPGSVADVLETARAGLVDRWNEQPADQKFALEWSEEICTHEWEESGGEAAGATQSQAADAASEESCDQRRHSSAVVVNLNTYAFTHFSERRRQGLPMEPEDVQVNIKTRSTALGSTANAARRAYVDDEGRRSDRWGFSLPSSRLIDLLRREDFHRVLVKPSAEYLARHDHPRPAAARRVLRRQESRPGTSRGSSPANRGVHSARSLREQARNLGRAYRVPLAPLSLNNNLVPPPLPAAAEAPPAAVVRERSPEGRRDQD